MNIPAFSKRAFQLASGKFLENGQPADASLDFCRARPVSGCVKKWWRRVELVCVLN
jgi:hypothetical protein